MSSKPAIRFNTIPVLRRGRRAQLYALDLQHCEGVIDIRVERGVWTLRLTFTDLGSRDMLIVDLPTHAIEALWMAVQECRPACFHGASQANERSNGQGDVE